MSINEIKDLRIREVDLQLHPRAIERLQQLRQTLGTEHDKYTDFALLRFLDHNNFHVANSAQQWKDYIEWRKANNVDRLAKEGFPALNAIRSVYANAIHGYDKENRPVYWERTGEMSPEFFTQFPRYVQNQQITLQDMLMFHCWGLEVLYEKCHTRSLESGQRINQICAIFDAQSIHLGHTSAIDFLRKCTNVDNLYYPGRVAKIYILNTPSFFPVLYNLAKIFIPQQIIDQVSIVTSANSFLQEKIPLDELPPAFGGNCDCSACMGV